MDLGLEIDTLRAVDLCFPGGPVVKNLPCNAGHTGAIPGPKRSHMLLGN